MLRVPRHRQESVSYFNYGIGQLFRFSPGKGGRGVRGAEFRKQGTEKPARLIDL